MQATKVRNAMAENITSPILELQRQRALLQIEYDAEKEEFRRQTEALGMRRKVKRGDAWWPLRVGRTYYNSLNQRQAGGVFSREREKGS